VRSNRRRLLLLTAASLALVSAVVIAALNIAFNSYIDGEARRMMAQEMQAFSEADTLDAAEWESDSPVHVSSLLLTADYRADEVYSYAYALTPLERAVVAYCREHPDLSGRMASVRLLEEELTLAQLPLRQPGEPQGMVVVLFANVTPLKAFLFWLNLIFLALLLLTGAGASLAGWRVGRQMDSAQERTRRFFANASHELKTPLTLVQGYAEGIQRGVAPDPRQAAGVILEAGDRMTALVDELLLISRIDSGALTLETSDFQLEELLVDCLSEIAPLAARRGLSLSLAAPEGLPPLSGDPVRLRRALMSVLDNALRYAKSRVDCDLSRQGGRLTLGVRDDGPGIPPGELPHVFERFFAGKNGHSGIGLSIAREIVQLHGGGIRAEDTGGGAALTLTLPVRGGKAGRRKSR